MKFALTFVLFILSCNVSLQDNKNVETIIKTKKSSWGIDEYKMRNQSYFDLKINNCFEGIVKDFVGEPETFFLYKKKLCTCIIQKIQFKNEKSLDFAYNLLNKEANAVRMGSRSEFGNVCFELREAQFYYVLKHDNFLYLFSDGNSYNYNYKNGKDSNDSIINQDQQANNELIFDDIYNSIKEEFNN